MTRDEILALYQWATGSCFRCARTDLPTTLLGEIDTPIGTHYEVRACKDCILDLEMEQLRLAERRGREYVPGQLGK